MTGYLFDENIPSKIRFEPSYPVTHVSTLGKSLSDGEIWRYAEQNDLAIVTKDSDFSDRIIVSSPPPRVIHLRFANMRRKEFHAYLSRVWPRVESLIATHKLVNVYFDKLEYIN